MSHLNRRRRSITNALLLRVQGKEEEEEVEEEMMMEEMEEEILDLDLGIVVTPQVARRPKQEHHKLQKQQQQKSFRRWKIKTASKQPTTETTSTIIVSSSNRSSVEKDVIDLEMDESATVASTRSNSNRSLWGRTSQGQRRAEKAKGKEIGHETEAGAGAGAGAFTIPHLHKAGHKSVESSPAEMRLDEDTHTVTSVRSRFSRMGSGLRWKNSSFSKTDNGNEKQKKNKYKKKTKIHPDLILSEFFDVQSVANDGRFHDRFNQERAVAQFFDIQSVRTQSNEVDGKHSNRLFGLFRGHQRKGSGRARAREETRSLASLSLGSSKSKRQVVFFHPSNNDSHPYGEGFVPDDETITLASGLASYSGSITIDESNASINGDKDEIVDYLAVDDPNSHLATSANAGTDNPGRSPSSSQNPEMNSITQEQKGHSHSVVSGLNRWRSQSSSMSKSSREDRSPSEKEGTDSRESNHCRGMSDNLSDVAPSPPDESKYMEYIDENNQDDDAEDDDEDDDEESIVSLISGIVANYATAQAEHLLLQQVTQWVAIKSALKSDSRPVPVHHVVFDSVFIREYARTVGDNPSCSCGPPVSLDWTYVICDAISINAFEASKPTKRTKKQFYLPPRLRDMMLREDWNVSEEDLKRARRDVTYIQYCRERSVSEARSHSPTQDPEAGSDGSLVRRSNTPTQVDTTLPISVVVAVKTTVPDPDTVGRCSKKEVISKTTLNRKEDESTMLPSYPSVKTMQQRLSSPTPSDECPSVQTPRLLSPIPSDEFKSMMIASSTTEETPRIINTITTGSCSTPTTIVTSSSPTTTLQRQDSLSSLGSLEIVRLSI